MAAKQIVFVAGGGKCTSFALQHLIEWLPTMEWTMDMPREKTTKQTLLSQESGLPLQSKSGQGCVFCQIAQKKKESLIVFDDEISIAFLDSRPLFLGHTLLIPKEHYSTISDLPPTLVGPYFTNVRLIAIAVEKSLRADGSFLAINNRISQSVPHLHIHIVPRKSGDGLRGFFFPRQKYRSIEEAEGIRQAIRSAISDLHGPRAN